MNATGKFVWLGLGIFLGIGIAAAIGVMVVDLLIPWEDICPILGPAQRLAEVGAVLIAELQSWLAKAESLLQTGSSNEASEEARTGLGSLLDRAGEIAGGVQGTAIDIVTAPLQSLIDLAQDMLKSIQETVDTALDVTATAQELGCE